MFAVIRTGGKQYKVSKDDIITVERLEAKAGEKVTFDDVLMLGENGKEPKIGEPTISGASVVAEVVDQGRADKVTVIKFRRRKKLSPHQRPQAAPDGFENYRYCCQSSQKGSRKCRSTGRRRG